MAAAASGGERRPMDLIFSLRQFMQVELPTLLPIKSLWSGKVPEERGFYGPVMSGEKKGFKAT